MAAHRETARDKILDAALALLSEKGFANVSMRDIAKEANVALSLLTYHFVTRENLFTALVTRLVRKCFDGASAALAKGEDEAERAHLLSEYFEDMLRNDQVTLRVLLDFSAQAMWNRSFRFQVTYMFDMLSDVIKNEILTEKVRENSKVLGKYDPSVVAKVFLGAFYGTAFRLLISDSVKEQDTAQVFELGNTLIDICRN